MSSGTATDVSPSSSIILPPPWKYHVYLSFRREDTRRGFVENFYAALKRKGLVTFIDEEELHERGEVIQQAIETSLSTIVIFSQNYASSTWCLDELQMIIEYKNKLGMLVIPVFHGVDPSDIREQRESLSEAFAKHEQRFDKVKVEKWRHALSEVANMVGWQTAGWYEWDLIEHVVSTVWKKLFNICRSIRGKSLSDFLVEILAKLASPEVTNFLAKRLVLDKIKQSLVCLSGMVAGIEKKTFTPKTSEEQWSSHLENILYLLDESIKHISMGREIIAEAKVNVILKELESMTEDPDLSVREQTISNEKKIIHFLQSFQESGRKNASVTVIVGGDRNQNTIMAGYVYSDETVEASFDLRGWVQFADELDALSLTKNILGSFNADFRDGDDLQTLVARLHECLSGRKFLLVINGWVSFQNWEIFEKCFEAAERGSSIILTAQKADSTKIADCVVFLDQDVVSISEAVRADFNSSEMDSSDWPDSIRDQFIWKTLHSTSSHYLGKQPKTILEEDVVPEEVHETESLAHPLEPQSPLSSVNLAINNDNDAEALRAADHQEAKAAEIMRVVDDQTEASSDQDIFDFFSSFETIRVSDVFQLKELPMTLHSLRIVECHFLESLAAEMENESLNLCELYMIDCGSLKEFVSESYCTSLTTLYINKCRKLEFPLSSVTTRTFSCLKHLNIGNSCDSLESFTLNLFPKLKTLCIWGCPNLQSLSLSEGFENLKLESLELRDCPKLTSFPTQGLHAPNLKSMRFSSCKILKSLPHDMASLVSLQSIILDRCPELESFPVGGLPSTLNLLSIAFCDKFSPQKEWELHRLHSLRRFEIESGCVGMKSFPENDLLPKNLISLRISKLLSLTSLDYVGLQDLTSLRSLEINSCWKLNSLPDEGFGSSLRFLCIKECPMLTEKLMYKAGAEWHKIAWIPKIQVDDKLILSNRTRGYSISGNGII